MKNIIANSRILLTVLIVMCSSIVLSQNIAITDDNGYPPDSSAMLDVKSTTKGLLIPRLTTIQRNGVNNPAKGLLVFDSDDNSFYFYNGASWINLAIDGDVWTKSGTNVFTTDLTNKVGVGTNAPVGKLEVKADGSINPGEPIFEVINSNGDTVFAVYSEGVRIYVSDSAAKGSSSKGGFAVGGFSISKGITNEYLRVTPDSVRIYIEENSTSKGSASKGGFAVGGFSISKGLTNEYLRVTNDSTRIWTEDTISGFGVENLSSTGESTSYMRLTPNNYFIGHQAGDSITTGLYNSFIGYQSGFNNKVGDKNYFIGYRSGYSNIDGTGNIFIGDSVGYFNTSGSKNIFMGNGAGRANISGKMNVCLGYMSGKSNTTGVYNVFIGALAGKENTEGTHNIFVGFKSGGSNTLGDYNTAAGYRTMAFNVIGQHNCAYGINALYRTDTANFNVAIGSNTLFANTKGSENTSLGAMSLHENMFGNYNTAVGYYANYSNIIGNNLTTIGANSNVSFDGLINSTALGANTLITASYQVRVGDAAVTSIGGFADWTNVSDKRFKKDIQENVPGLDFILKLKPVTYHLDMNSIAIYLNKPDSVRSKESDELKSSILQTGFVAQDVEKAANESGFDFSGVDKPKNDKDFYGLRYAEFTVPLVKAVQEQQEIIDNHKKEIENLKKETISCKIEIENLKIQMDRLNSLLLNTTSNLEGSK